MSSLKVGDQGPDVGIVQQMLIEAGETINQQELDQSLFGPSMKTAVLDFQSSHVGPNGHLLDADGLVGPFTLAALHHPQTPTESFIASGWSSNISDATNPEAAAAVGAAIGEIGTKEDPDGSNRGPRVDEYEGPDWLGSPWCALFASFCWAKAPHGSPFGVLASALKMRDWGVQNNALVSSNDLALPGDIGIILRAGGRGHVEMAVAKEIAGQPLSLVGGNVGNAVRGTVRPRNAFSHLMRPVNIRT